MCGRRGPRIDVDSGQGAPKAMSSMPKRSLVSYSHILICSVLSKSAEASMPDPVREELTVLVRARKQMIDRHRRLLNEAEALDGELLARLIERLPGGASVAPRLAAVARVHLTGEHLT